MPGAWEQPQPNVLVATLTREMVCSAWAKSYRDLILPNGSAPLWMSGAPFDHGRNICVERCLENGFQWLFFLDDDVILPPDSLIKLVNRNLDIVSGLYYRRKGPIAPVMLKDTPPNPQFIVDAQLGQLVEADLVGAGCLLIRRKVLETLKEPLKKRWFDWRCDREDLEPFGRCSEDFAFCREARKAGFKIFVDTTVQCIHAGLGASMAGGKYEPLVMP